MDNLIIGGHQISSRLLTGSGKFADKRLIPEMLKSSDSQIITLALRRVDLNSDSDNLLDYIPENIILLPNTSGARNADEAIRIARLAQAMGCGNWIKIECISDNKYLLPDNYETLKATEILAKEGFIVLPYMSPDLMSAKSMESAGAAAVMPLGAPIGSNRGIKTKELISILIDEIKIPIIVDAGIGMPSHAAEAMEMGADAVLVNTAIATAKDPISMGLAFKNAVIAGRLAYNVSSNNSSITASASSPLTGFLGNSKEV